MRFSKKNFNHPPKTKPSETAFVSIDYKSLYTKLIEKEEAISFNLSQNDKTDFLIGVSLLGKSHFKENLPRQDNHKFLSLKNGWGIAVVSDGAGSSKHSDIGSKLVTERTTLYLKQLIEESEWIKEQKLPSEKNWDIEFRGVISKLRSDFNEYAKIKKVQLKDLNSTLLALVYSPYGILFGHIGDGRAAVLRKDSGWKSIMTPHKGEEANQTLFLQSEIIEKPNLKISGVYAPETIVIKDQIDAFILITDGCEKAMWECGKMELTESGMRFCDPNVPFANFLNPLIIAVQRSREVGDENEIKDGFINILKKGTSVLERETDDKTCVFGLLK